MRRLTETNATKINGKKCTNKHNQEYKMKINYRENNLKIVKLLSVMLCHRLGNLNDLPKKKQKS